MKFRYSLLILFLFVAVSGCRDDAIVFNYDVKSGNIYISSDPKGASIYFNDTDTGKVTPDSLINLQPGDYEIRVILLGVGEGVTYVNVEPGEKKYIKININ